MENDITCYPPKCKLRSFSVVMKEVVYKKRKEKKMDCSSCVDMFAQGSTRPPFEMK